METIALDNLLQDVLAAAAGLSAAFLLFKRLPVWATLVSLKVTIRKAFTTIMMTAVSDHWKEVAVRRYALRLLMSSCRLAVFMLVLVVVFAAGFVVVQLLFMESLQYALTRLLRWEPQLLAAAIGIPLFLFLQRVRR